MEITLTPQETEWLAENGYTLSRYWIEGNLNGKVQMKLQVYKPYCGWEFYDDVTARMGKKNDTRGTNKTIYARWTLGT
jgi:hypothetical protein